MRRYLPFAIIALVLIAVVGAVAWMLSSKQLSGNENPVAPAASNTNTSTQPASQPTEMHARGASNAVVTLEEFGDYQCPPCGRLHPEIKKVEAQFGDRLRFIFRNYPMTKIHEHAMEAARAAEAAGLQGRFWEMHDLLYDKQAEWKDEKQVRTIFQNYARELGLDVDRFTRDLDSPATEQHVTVDQKWGESLGVDATPTLFINGRQLRPEMMTADGMTMAINYLLSQQRPQQPQSNTQPK